MTKLDFKKLTMRDDFEYQVHLSKNVSECNDIYQISSSDTISGVIKKQKNEIYLTIDNSLLDFSDAKDGALPIYSELGTEEDFGILYASSWDNSVHFIIRKYFGVETEQRLNYNSVSHGPVVTYRVLEMSIGSQLALKEQIEEANYYLDYIHGWFNLFDPNTEWEENSNDLLVIKNIEFEGVTFTMIVRGNLWQQGNVDKVERYAQTFIKVKFNSPQTRDKVFGIGVQIRNMFQLILNCEIGLYKIILNRNESFETDKMLPKNFQENYFISQSYLPDIHKVTRTNYDIEYKSINEDLNRIIVNFFSSKKLQDFAERFLTVKQYKMPLPPVLLTISSAVESYLSDLKFSDGRQVKNLHQKINVIFNDTLKDKQETIDIVQKIKDSRDFYTHSDKQKKKLTEAELIPIVTAFIEKTNQFLLNEVLLKTNWLHK